MAIVCFIVLQCRHSEDVQLLGHRNIRRSSSSQVPLNTFAMFSVFWPLYRGAAVAQLVSSSLRLASPCLLDEFRKLVVVLPGARCRDAAPPACLCTISRRGLYKRRPSPVSVDLRRCS